MGRRPCCSKEGLNRGAWTATEDKSLTDYIKLHGEGKWRDLPKKAGLKRCGKSCRLRWLNYLRPDIKRGNISDEEEDLILRLHRLLGNRWSLIAGRLPGRTDNEIKNYWNTNLGKKVRGQSTQLTNYKYSAKNPEAEISVPEEHFEPCVIRTKALRCSKIFTVPRENRVESSNQKVDTELATADDFSTQKGLELESHQIPSLTTAYEDDSSNSLMNFEVPDLSPSALLDSEFLQFCDDGSQHDYDGNNSNRSPLLHSLLFNEENLGEWTGSDCIQPEVASDLQALASFLDSEEEWHGE